MGNGPLSCMQLSLKLKAFCCRSKTQACNNIYYRRHRYKYSVCDAYSNLLKCSFRPIRRQMYTKYDQSYMPRLPLKMLNLILLLILNIARFNTDESRVRDCAACETYTEVTIDNLHDRLKDELGSENEIFYYSQKEHLKISRIA